ncbi:hypothetical protein [uncultured Nitrospira sp.]|uniref:hypothetical protein n=1 Tax=uncultured Nitrospira sp. TaxID=157176 RepID=UPI0031407A95
MNISLLFFAAIFVFMASVWQTGVFQEWTAHLQMDLTSLPSILGLSIILSQLISNVPLVALYLLWYRFPSSPSVFGCR